jgi:hypothetical protein
VQPTGAIIDNTFDHTSPTMPPALGARRHNPPAYRRSLARLQLANRSNPSSVLVAPWAMEQEIAQRADFEPGKQSGPLGTYPGQ